MKNEKIEQWEKEIEQAVARQKEFAAKTNEKVRELRRKIEAEQKRVEIESNQMIADAVRELFGDVEPEDMKHLKERLQSLVGKE